MTRSHYDIFHAVVKDLIPEKDKVAILSHKDADPDSIGSAVGIKWLLKKKYNIPSRIYIDGDSEHRQLQTLYNVLDIAIHKTDMVEIGESSKIIMVDTFNTKLYKRVDLIVDHHRCDDVTVDNSSNIIEPVGSCCTLIYEMIKDAGLKLVKDRDDEIATCLYFGIRTDTCELLSDAVTPKDWYAYQELSEFIDRQKVAQIINYSYPSYFREIEKIAMSEDNYKEFNGWFVCGVGYVPQSRKNTLSMLSEKMIRYEGIETAIIFGIRDSCLEVSVRSKNNSIDVSKLAKSLFGQECAGGRRGAGGAKVPLHFLFPDNMPDELVSNVWEYLKKLVFYRAEQKSIGN